VAGMAERRAASGRGLDCLICGRLSVRSYVVYRRRVVGIDGFLRGFGICFAFLFAERTGGGLRCGLVVCCC
jgi:hypothetical protein